MKTTKLLVACLASTILFSSCDELKGTLVSNIPIAVQKDGKPYVLRTGSNKIEVKVKNENTIQLKAQTTAGEKDIKINTNFNAKQLRDGQIIDIPASITGQSFGVRGSFSDVTTYSGITNSTESCTYTCTEQQCHPEVVTECNPRRPTECRTRSVNICNDIQVTHNGRQDVSYHYSQRQVTAHLDLVVDGQVQGRIDSGRSSSDKIYDFRGSCR